MCSNTCGTCELQPSEHSGVVEHVCTVRQLSERVQPHAEILQYTPSCSHTLVYSRMVEVKGCSVCKLGDLLKPHSSGVSVSKGFWGWGYFFWISFVCDTHYMFK